MILSSTNTLENKKIISYHGLVTGESLIGANVYKDLFSGVRDVVGSELPNMKMKYKKHEK